MSLQRKSKKMPAIRLMPRIAGKGNRMRKDNTKQILEEIPDQISDRFYGILNDISETPEWTEANELTAAILLVAEILARIEAKT